MKPWHPDNIIFGFASAWIVGYKDLRRSDILVMAVFSPTDALGSWGPDIPSWGWGGGGQWLHQASKCLASCQSRGLPAPPAGRYSPRNVCLAHLPSKQLCHTGKQHNIKLHYPPCIPSLYKDGCRSPSLATTTTLYPTTHHSLLQYITVPCELITPCSQLLVTQLICLYPAIWFEMIQELSVEADFEMPFRVRAAAMAKCKLWFGKRDGGNV